MEREINQLIKHCMLFFSDNCYTQSRIDKYRSLWKNGILRYMNEKNLSIYCPSLGQEYVMNCIPYDNLRHDDREKIRSIQVLDDYLNLGIIRKRTVAPVKHELYGEIGIQMNKLIDHLHSLRRSSVTIKNYELYLNRFLSYLNRSGVFSLNEMKERHILEFVSTTENNKINIVSSLRVLFRFWYEHQITDLNFEDVLRYYKWVKHEKIPSYFAADEVRVIEESVDRSSGVGKRDYAMILLASRLGLRASDIAQLQFSNLDWERNEIRLTQYKTGSPITLPLLSDVGNAIIDYLKYGRFKSESQHVFITCRAPYIPASKSTVCSAIRENISKSRVITDGRHHGPHSLRHSLASCLLKNEVPMPVISEVLGHAKTDTTMKYLRIDLTSLIKCTLAVPCVADSFYMQKGGVFYE
ncbi:MAG: site-specific integrase [Bacteroidales bacterium]|nr:site-specific integrase [Bacteroidales bacterium]